MLNKVSEETSMQKSESSRSLCRLTVCLTEPQYLEQGVLRLLRVGLQRLGSVNDRNWHKADGVVSVRAGGRTVSVCGVIRVLQGLKHAGTVRSYFSRAAATSCRP